MGTNPQTWKDYYTRNPLIPTSGVAFWNLTGRIANLIDCLEVPYTASSIEENCRQLAIALSNFALNRYRWSNLDNIVNRKLLQQHLVFTLLVPGGKASRARTAVDNLTALDILPIQVPCSVASIESSVRPYTRFPNQKWSISVRRWICGRLK